MKIIAIIWEVIKLLLGGMNYDMAVHQASIKYHVGEQVIYMNLEKRGYYRKDYVSTYKIEH